MDNFEIATTASYLSPGVYLYVLFPLLVLWEWAGNSLLSLPRDQKLEPNPDVESQTAKQRHDTRKHHRRRPTLFTIPEEYATSCCGMLFTIPEEY